MAAVATTFVLEAPPPVNAIDDLDWYANDAASEMGEGSAFGGILERASLDRRFVPPNLRDMHDPESLRDDAGKPMGHYETSYAAGRWLEWQDDASMVGGGYARDVWGARPSQSTYAVSGTVSEERIEATEMYRNIADVLERMPSRMRVIGLVQHMPRAHSVNMRNVFAGLVRIVALSEAARRGFRAAERKRYAVEQTVSAWLEGVAGRWLVGNPRAGEKAVIEDARSESSRDRKLAYLAFEEAREACPKGRLYPHMVRGRRALYDGAGGG